MVKPGKELAERSPAPNKDALDQHAETFALAGANVQAVAAAVASLP